MPFQIIRNDITKVKADAIVNTANPEPTYGAGTDSAIYNAAGADKLLKERKKIGILKTGDVAVTPAFDLDAKYIIHVVSPAWIDGKHSEIDILKSCYEKVLKKADSLGCKSIAFPLLATGVYGFPKDKGLSIAMSTLQEFALSHDMQIFLVTFDKDSYELSGKVFDNIKAYVDEHYVEGAEEEYYYLEKRALEGKEAIFKRRMAIERRRRASNSPEFYAFGSSSKQYIKDEDKTFQEKLFEYIDQSDIKKDSEFYKYISISKQTFSDMRSDTFYQPSRQTAIKCCIKLKLDIVKAEDLLLRAGFALSPSKKDDMIIKSFIIEKEYDKNVIDDYLEKEGVPTLFSKA